MKFLYAVLIVLLVGGCGTVTIDKQLVKQYTKPLQLESDETLIYVIRERAFKGGANAVWIANNDKVIASLDSGEYTYFKVKNQNIIHTVFMREGYSFYAVDKHHNEPIFLILRSENREMERISYELGISYLAKYDKVDNLPSPKYSEGYEAGLINIAMINNLDVMVESNETLFPDEKNAVITFVRPSSSGKSFKYTIWSDDNIIGNLNADSYFQIKVPAGQYNYYLKNFYGYGFTSSVRHTLYILEANVSANKNYFVELDVSADELHNLHADVELNPINANNYTKVKEKDGVLFYTVANDVPEEITYGKEKEDKYKSITMKHLKLNKPFNKEIQKRINTGASLMKTLLQHESFGKKKVLNEIKKTRIVMKSTFGK